MYGVNWTAADKRYLRRNINKGYAHVAKHLGRTVGSVHNAAARMGIKSDRWWSEEERQYLRDNLKHGHRHVAEHLGRSVCGVHSVASALGIRVDRWWTPEQEAHLRAHYRLVGAKGLAAHFGKSYMAVRSKAIAMGLGKPTKRRPWLSSEDDFLREHLGKQKYRWIGGRLGRSEASVQRRAYVIGLRARPKRDMEALAAEILRYKRRGYSLTDISVVLQVPPGTVVRCSRRYKIPAYSKKTRGRGARRRCREYGANFPERREAMLRWLEAFTHTDADILDILDAGGRPMSIDEITATHGGMVRDTVRRRLRLLWRKKVVARGGRVWNGKDRTCAYYYRLTERAKRGPGGNYVRCNQRASTTAETGPGVGTGAAPGDCRDLAVGAV